MTDADATRRFAGRVAEYARWRPGYPPELLSLLRQDLGLRREDVVADVGSGTGLLTRLFLENGNPVVAVEPDPAMRRVAEEELGGDPSFHSVAGTAEDTTLDAESVDLVVAGQAFHWFDREAAREEFRRILRIPRRVALIWYTRVVEGSPFMEDLERLLLEHGTDYRSVRHDRIPRKELRRFFSGGYRRSSLPHGQVLVREGLRGRLRSMSYLPAPGEPGHEDVIAEADRLFREHAEDGRVTIEYELEVHLGRL